MGDEVNDYHRKLAEAMAETVAQWERKENVRLTDRSIRIDVFAAVLASETVVDPEEQEAKHDDELMHIAGRALGERERAAKIVEEQAGNQQWGHDLAAAIRADKP